MRDICVRAEQFWTSRPGFTFQMFSFYVFDRQIGITILNFHLELLW